MLRITFILLLLLPTTLSFADENKKSVYSGKGENFVVASASYMETLLLYYEPEDLVAVATGVAQPISRAPSVATVITAENIKALGGSTLHEILESVAGLHMVISTVHRAWPTYTFRGIYTINPAIPF